MAFGQQLPEQKYEYLDHTADVQLHSWGDNLTEAFEQVAMAMFGYMTTNYDTVEMTDEFEVEAEVKHVDKVYKYNKLKAREDAQESMPCVYKMYFISTKQCVRYMVQECIDSTSCDGRSGSMLFAVGPDLKASTYDTCVIIGEDMMSLLFHFLDEWLFVFSADPFFIPRKVVITEFDNVNFRIKSKGYGETFDIQKHPQGGREGIRLLASYILFSNDYSEIQGTEVKAITYSNMQIYDNDEMHEVFVIIDI